MKTTQFGVKTLVALYMVAANTDKVTTKDLFSFGEKLNEQLTLAKANFPQGERSVSTFLVSDFYVRQFAQQHNAIFSVSKMDESGNREIVCTKGKSMEEKIGFLTKNILFPALSKNPDSISYASKCASQLLNSDKKTKTKREKPLSQEQDDERWFQYFGK